MSSLPVERFPFRTLPALLRHTAQRIASRRFLRELDPDAIGRVPIECTFAQFERAVAATAEFLAENGIQPSDRVLFVAENSRHYQVLLLAAQALRAEPCTVFSNLGPSATQDVARRIRPRCLFVSSEAGWNKLAPIAETLVESGLRLRISPKPLGDPPPGVTDHAASVIAETPYSTEDWGRRVDAVGPDGPFLLVFTSGTSGKQKGVVLRQDAFVRSLEGGQAATCMSEADDGLMFLPFAHIAGQCQFMLAIAMGHSLIMVSRREDLPIAFSLGPTYAFAVPLVYEKILARAAERLQQAPWPLRAILAAAFAAAQHDPKSAAGTWKESLLLGVARRAIGGPFRRSLGGRLRMVVSGGATARPSLRRFFEAMRIPFLTIYGMSETCGLICSQICAGQRDPDSVGLPSPDLELEIDPGGELLIRGSLLMQGYIDPEDHAGAFDGRGFFRTGDLVSRDPNTGQFRLIGRSKNLVVLSTGKKISAEPIETELQATWPVTGALLLGDGRPYATALLFVPPEAVRRLGGDDAVVSTLLTLVNRALSGFSDYERPKRLLVVKGSANDDPDFVTPTLKLKRDAILEAFSASVQRLYDSPSGNGVLLDSSPGP